MVWAWCCERAGLRWVGRDVLVGMGGLLVWVMIGGCARAPLVDLRGEGRGGLERYYLEKGGVVPCRARSIRVINGAEAIRSAMIELARGAEDHVLVDSFLLSDGEASRGVLDALVDKSAEGVKVYVIGDASSRYVPEPQGFDVLEEGGVATAEFSLFGPPRAAIWMSVLERDHRKFWVVDGKVVMLGGANVSDLSLLAEEEGGNRDLMVWLESEGAAREMTESFVGTWERSRSRHVIRPGELVAGEGVEGEVEFLLFNQDRPGEAEGSFEVMIDGLLASAERSVCLVQPYTFVNPWIVGRIRELSRRGVVVRIYLSGQVRAPRFRYAARYGILDLLRAGAEVWELDMAFSPLHSKCVVVDGELAAVGSANLNYRSQRLSREIGVVLVDEASVGEVMRAVEDVRAKSLLVGWDEARADRDLVHWCWWALMQLGG
jgi:cardiolipin synthase A/B